jgi:uncharacterized membrane protein
MEAKINRVMLFVTSIVCLLPICLSFALYNDLPERMVMQWNFELNPNWYAHKVVGAFGLPLFLLAIHILTNILVYKTPKRENISKAMLAFTMWLIPVISLIVMPLMLFMNLGVKLPLTMIVFIFIGVLFIIIGNYLPKNRQNFFAGIRVPWTLNNAENWNKTHRMAGYLWIIAGILFIAMAFLSLKTIVGLVVILAIITIAAVVPVLYSYCLHKREGKNKSCEKFD